MAMVIVTDSFLPYLILILVGLCMGSFAGATVWRLRARQLVEDSSGESKSEGAERREISFLLKYKGSQDRSRCLHCHHILAWYDLLPILSWISLGGKCRYCREPIGYLEPLIEIGLASFFVGSFVFWPVPIVGVIEIIQFILWLLAGTGLAILFVYDLKWFLLPDLVSFPLIGVSMAYAALAVFMSHHPAVALLSLAISVAILSGLYFILHAVSRGTWVGYGDVKLGLSLALLLGDWKVSFLALFAANFIGSMIVIPGLLQHKLRRDTHVPFGPLLIGGFVFAAFWGRPIIQWYLSNLGV